MTIYAYVTEQCWKDAAKHALTEVVQRIGAQVESSQSVSTFDNFPVPYFVKKKLKGRQPRLIADLRHFDEHQVLVMLRVLMRSDHEYEGFVQEPVEYGERNFLKLVSEEELRRHVAEQSAQPEVAVKPAPSDEEYDYLYNALAHVGLPDSERAEEVETIICESHVWVEQVANPSIRRQLNLVSQCCRDLLAMSAGLGEFEVSGKSGWKVWAFRGGRYVLLVAIDDGSDSATVAQRAREIAGPVHEEDPESVLRVSRRAYPSIVLADEELWLKLEEESEANMALSPEETKVLLSARSTSAPFPLFINGRAGSGKSTLLQYLFADLLFAHATKFSHVGDERSHHPVPGLPLYLTANGELLRNARAFVGRLLGMETRYLLAGTDGLGFDDARREAILEKSFQEFHPFMLGLLPLDKIARFKPAQRIDYPAFRRLWQERFGKDPHARRAYGPDLSWHVIRSYIKGMNSVDDFGPEDYDELPQNQVTVSRATFELVYQRVWQGWYEPLCEQGHWDDQDLARLILDDQLAQPVYASVFCDEAQDFTRIEIEVLMRLCLYSARTLPHGAVKLVPFAFAGDEFQTLNPTGFRWDAVKAAFVEKLIFEIDPQLRREGAELNYHELRYNYRSAAPIVSFCNTVQAVRAARFGIQELRPQQTWAPSSGSPPVLFFDTGNGEFWNAFRDAAAGYVIIVPCLEGEESDFVREDPVLRERVPFDDGIPRNILSAGRAKGCEYPAVIVYGFGEALASDLVGSIGEISTEINVPQTLELQYFVNRVYVAVSRAKRRLVVVDTAAGVERLWKPAMNEYVRERVLRSLGNKQDIWSEAVGGMSTGLPADLSTDAPPDRAAYARLFESDGRAKRDAYLMYQASSNYRDAGDSARARECRAWALEYEDRALEAGEAFGEAGLLNEARRVLWRAERPGWLKLLEIAQRHPQLVAELETRWAKTIQQPPDLKAAAEIIDAFDERLRIDSAFVRSVYGDKVWGRAVEQLLEPLFSERGKAVPAAIASKLLSTVNILDQHGVEVQRRLLAEISFAAENFSHAAELWEQVGDKRSRRYLKAKALSTAYPDCIAYFKLLDDRAAVVAAFDAHREVPLDDSQARAVATALSESGRYGDALTCLGEVLAIDVLMEMARAALVPAPDIAVVALRRAVVAAVTVGEWEVVCRLISEPQTLVDTSSIGIVGEKMLNRWVPELRILLVRALARSDALVETTAYAQRDVITKFLSDFLRVKDGTWIGRISFVEGGAAMERTGRFNDPQQYYWAVLHQLGGQLSDDDRTNIRLRWLAVKTRQLEVEKSRGPGDAAKRRQISREIDKNAADWRIGEEARRNLPRFPVLDPLSAESSSSAHGQHNAIGAAVAKAYPPDDEALPEPQLPLAAVPMAHAAARAASADVPTRPVIKAARTSLTPRMEVKAGDLRFEVQRDQRRCLVTHLVTLETVRVEWAPPRVVATLDVKRSGGEGNLHEVGEWNFSIRFVGGDDPARIIFRLDSEGAEVALEI